VTSETKAASAAERKRQQRERDRQSSGLLYERQDWSLFLDVATLPQKAGCYPKDLRKIILKEIVDNALDTGAHVTMERDGKTWIIADDGPGIDPGQIPTIFSVNRPLLSSKLKRMPLRGMLGNGLRVVMGATAAFPGASITVETRGHRLHLAVDRSTGLTTVTADDSIAEHPGLTVLLSLGDDPNHDDGILARHSIVFARDGSTYNGPSSPWWYGPR
jgi:histidine kinase/DNA gyrase B/HSP90-like ATPase